MEQPRAWLASPESLIRRAKLAPPPLGPGIVPRPRLVRCLEDALAAPVTLVAGPAGFGKTTAISEWVRNTSRRVAWLTLDEGDAALPRFVPHLRAALESALPIDGHRALAEPFEQLGRSPRLVGESIAEALFDLDRDLVLVLDDFHEATSTETSEVISAIIQYPPPALRLIVSARWDPQLPIARLRGRGWLSEIRAADLRFTDEETRALLESAMEADPDAETVTLLQERTEGWAAGLRLASVAMRSRADVRQLDASLTASGDRHVMDFLLDEVLARQSPDAQDFLLKTAITDRICGPLADAIVPVDRVTAASDLRLEALMRANLYLEQADSPEQAGSSIIWYRYHRLFRDLLRHRLSLEASPGDIAGCHARASSWFAGEGMIEEAVRHAVAAGESDNAADLIENARLQALWRGQVGMIESWLQWLPERTVSTRPALQLTRACIALLRGQTPAARSILRNTERAMANQTPVPGAHDHHHRNRLLLELNLLLGMTLDTESSSTDLEAQFASALAELPADDPEGQTLAVYLGSLLRSVVRGANDSAAQQRREVIAVTGHEESACPESLMADALLERANGNVYGAQRLAHYARRVAARHDAPMVVEWAGMMLGSVAYDRNELDTAEQLLAGMESRQYRDYFRMTRDGLIILVMTRQALGQHDRAIETAASLVEMVLDLECFEHLPVAEALQVRLALLRNDHELPRRWLDGRRSAASGSLADIRYVQLTRILVLMAAGTADQLEEAARIADACLADLNPSTPARDRLEVTALHALVRFQLSRANAEAITSGDDVRLHWRRTVEQGLTRVVADFGPIVPGTLEALRIDPAAESWAAILLAACGQAARAPSQETRPAARVEAPPAPQRPRSPHVLEVLTERESAVLACLGEHLSNQEIADRLFISPLTVKRHASNIYDKLGVSSRRQALVKAIELGFIERRSSGA